MFEGRILELTKTEVCFLANESKKSLKLSEPFRLRISALLDNEASLPHTNNQNRMIIMKPIHLLAGMGAFALTMTASLAKEQIPATDVLIRIDTEEPITIKNASIQGDLDFTQLRKKTPGGSYGGRVGMVKEFFTKLKAPLTLEDCVIEGGIITFREDRRRLLLKEFFVAFDAPLILRRCKITGPVSFERLTFYDRLVIEDCEFEEKVRIDQVRFSKAPEASGNTLHKGLENKRSNWDEETGNLTDGDQELAKKEPSIAIVLRNPSSQDVPIQFGDNKWNLSPRGNSTLRAAPGTKIYLTERGQKKRELLTLSPEMAGHIFDVTRLTTP